MAAENLDGPKIRAARPSDAAQICEVLIRSVHEVCGPDYGHDPAVLDEWCSNKKPEIVAEWIESPNNFLVVADLPSHGVVGVGMYIRPKASITLCYLAPEALHRGIGSILLSALEAEAHRLEHREITLSSTITARNFYARHGYTPNGEPFYWGKVFAVPMRKLLAT